jgi:hypothetical protein
MHSDATTGTALTDGLGGQGLDLLSLQVSQQQTVTQLVDGVGTWGLGRTMSRAPHVTRHTSHVTRHKSHVTRDTSLVTCQHACKEQPVGLEHAMHLQIINPHSCCKSCGKHRAHF